jgi:MORN repeat variant
MEHSINFLGTNNKSIVHLLNYAPDPVIVQILLNIHPNNLEGFCSLNKRVRRICKSNIAKETYHKKWFYEARSLADAKAFLRKNPNGLLFIKIDADFTNKDLLEVADQIIYLEQKHDTFNMAVFRSLRNLKTYRIYHKGKLNKETNYKDFQPDGLYRIWHENGQLGEKGAYKNGKLNGLQRKWSSDGQLEMEATYKNGKKKGLYRKWLNGQLEKEKIYL